MVAKAREKATVQPLQEQVLAQEAQPQQPQPRRRLRRAGVCLVDDANCVGGAVNGKVCSYHAMSYRPDGTRRP
jgi:hypothetical protein